MLRFFASRLLQSLLALIIIITATFFMLRFVPGGPFTSEKAVTPEILRNLEAHYGLDQPLWKQYFDYLGSLAQGDFGPSFKYPNRTVNEILADKLPVSLELGFLSLLVALLIGLPLGILAAVRRNTWVDYVASSFGMVGISIPTFVVGPLLVLALAIHLGWFNASGWYSPIDRVLPCLVLGIAYAAPISRLTRGGMLEVLSQDFIRTARAKGASETTVLWRHAFANALAPVLTVLALSFGGLVSGALITETMFAWPGMGKAIYQAILDNDYNLALVGLLMATLATIAGNLAADLAYVWVDPRVSITGDAA